MPRQKGEGPDWVVKGPPRQHDIVASRDTAPYEAACVPVINPWKDRRRFWSGALHDNGLTALCVPLSLKPQSGLESELAVAQQANADLIQESERQSVQIEAQAQAIDELAAEKAEISGRLGQMESDLDAAREDEAAERQAAEHARTELAKALLRLEAMPRLETDLVAVRAELENERQKRIDADRLAAVMSAQKADQDNRVAEMRATIEQLTASVKTLQARADAQAAELADARVAVQTGTAKLDAANRDLADARQATEQAREQARAAGEQAAELRGVIEGQRSGAK